MASTVELPKHVEDVIATFVEAAKDAFQSNLVAVVLYGSAAEGRLRATSDVNMLLVLRRFDQDQANHLGEPMRIAHAAVEMNAMFLLETELSAAMDAFAVKFSDIRSRHRTLYGEDPFANLVTSRNALIARLKQVSLNLQIRLRERFILTGQHEEQLALVVADATGPLRSIAASLLQLEGHPALAPKEALVHVVQQLEDSVLSEVLPEMSMAREERQLKPGKAATTLMSMLRLIASIRGRIDQLR
ncbi:MAG TPA: nucleotidyltransferase domain-containing protein [Burkholderiales bacterium]|jgi:predicted nucleotidyltransferase|nr:nucleotidyltransferase domain-containing protein [Burkholderiales bacterium]